MTLYLMHCQPDMRKLILWGERHRVLRMNVRRENGYAQDDTGYALHGLLRATFGELAPKPFWHRGDKEGLWAFTTQEPEVMRARAASAPQDVAAVLGLHGERADGGLRMKKYPTVWKAGHRLGFDVRVRPVIRSRAGAEGRSGIERDAFLVAATPHEKNSASSPERAAVYSQWLTRQLATGGAAALLAANLIQFQLTSVVRQQAPTPGTPRERSLVTGPDAVLSGMIEVQNPAAFAALLERGIGRHRTFGFGLLLLRPAG